MNKIGSFFVYYNSNEDKLKSTIDFFGEEYEENGKIVSKVSTAYGHHKLLKELNKQGIDTQNIIIRGIVYLTVGQNIPANKQFVVERIGLEKNFFMNNDFFITYAKKHNISVINAHRAFTEIIGLFIDGMIDDAIFRSYLKLAIHPIKSLFQKQR